MDKRYVGAIDQGTTSTRFILYDRDGLEKASSRREHSQIYPKPGWVEHDALEIWDRTCGVIRDTLDKSGISPGEIAAIGITNQRETTVVWNKETGRPYYNAIVWQDTRTSGLLAELGGSVGIDRFRDITGLPLATYFSGPKIKWLLDNISGLKEASEKGLALFGNIDAWLCWNLTGRHFTDFTNASRTLLFNIHKLSWDDRMLDIMGIDKSMLPMVRPSSSSDDCPMTKRDGPFGEEIPLSGNLGDQQAALFGQACFDAGDAKNTYGTGCFLLMNTGDKPVISKNGLLTTVGYSLGNGNTAYALEGSIAVAGSLVQWARDKLCIIKSAPEIDELASSVPDNGGVYYVPAFSGLFAPHWRSDARGVIAGLTHYAGKAQIARAILEATAYQTRDVFDAMMSDSGLTLKELKVDGGMTVSDILMQFQADILNVKVLRPTVTESTARGAAYAAGLAVGFWDGLDDLRKNWKLDREWKSEMDEDTRQRLYRFWKKALEKSFGWTEQQ